MPGRDSDSDQTGDQSVLIDLSSWYKDSLAPQIELIRSAIDGCRELQFLYYAPKGESWRIIEPYYLIFRWSSWYVWGWCGLRKDFRLFKLNRMEELRLSENTFAGRSEGENEEGAGKDAGAVYLKRAGTGSERKFAESIRKRMENLQEVLENGI